MADQLFECNCKFCGTFITSKSQEVDGARGIISVAKMIDSRKFWYGLSGVFEFKLDLGLKEGDSLCFKCMKKHEKDFAPALSVKCANCEEMYQPLWKDGKFGYGCAADVEERDGKVVVGGGYGSNYDCMLFELTIPVFKIDDLLCDKCIAELVEEGTLVEIVNDKSLL